MHKPLIGYTLIEQPGPAQMEQIFHLRGYAWQSRLPDFPDNYCFHWAILHESSVVAAARLSLVGSLEQVPNAEVYSQVLPQLIGIIGSINRLVVHPAHAQRGLSQWLDQARLARADAAGAAHVVAQTFAGIGRVATLLNLGFCVAGEAGAYGSGPLVQMNALTAPSDGSEQHGVSTVALIRSKANY
jgi:GNAT superfamily N-acetyltransferase